MSDKEFKTLKDICISKDLLKKWGVFLVDQKDIDTVIEGEEEFVRFPDARSVYKENISK